MDALGTLLREGIGLVGWVGGPLFLILLVTGLGLGVMQAATQINDPSVGFLPRLVICGIAVVGLGPWMVERLAELVRMGFERLGQG